MLQVLQVLLRVLLLLPSTLAVSTRVLAYGDSLTAGFYHEGGRLRFAPYAPHLSARLGGCTVDWIGLSGYTASQMLLSTFKSSMSFDFVQHRWHTLTDALQAAVPPYTHVVILAGTNDLGRLSTAPSTTQPHSVANVTQDILALHSIVHASGAISVAVTIPQPAFEAQHRAAAEGRIKINTALIAFAAGNTQVRLVNLEEELANLAAPEAVRSTRWEPDGLHLTPAGYEELAALVERQAFMGEGCGGAHVGRGEALEVARSVALH